ncbi:transcriptional regulator, partial [Listeria monocytogenes]|nr:transcriptional regulator [Listeria monocytogenes]
FNATQIRKARGIDKGNNILDFLTAKEQEAVNMREQQIATLIGLGMDYEQIKAILANGGVIYQTTLKMPAAAH